MQVRGVPATTLAYRDAWHSGGISMVSCPVFMSATCPTLVEAARAAPPEGGYPPIQLRHVDIGGDRLWSREDIYGDDGR